MREKLFIVFMILLATSFSSCATVHKSSETIPLDFSHVGNGMLLRDKNDRVYSVVVESYEGFQEFKEQYPVEVDLNEEDFNDSLYIIGLIDKCGVPIAVDGFKQYVPYYYYLDIVEKDFIMKNSLPSVTGKKCTSYVIIKVSKKVVDRHTIRHVRIRKGVYDGLTKWY